MNQKQIFELIEKFKESSLSELEVESEGFRISMKSSAAVHIDTVLPAPSLPASAPAQASAPAPVDQISESNEIITAPLVGTFYRAPATDAPPFVEEGSIVKAGDSLCIIEAMKIMNKLEAEFPCEIVRILAENGQMVEYGAPLFEVKRK